MDRPEVCSRRAAPHVYAGLGRATISTMSDTAAQPTNRLANETSPYLLQHSRNPVDWYPWGPEAFAEARRRNVPVFVSVGYSTCYWCHVMERECFENPAVAAVMNAKQVNVKVDREERPDVDQLYMTAVQLLTRHGGWPMSVWLTPDRRPFYGGTYFPAADHGDRPGFPRLVEGLADAYVNRKPDVERSADELVDALKQLAEPPPPKSPIVVDEAFVARLVKRSTSDYDSRNGGFGAAPKFPRQTLLELLLVYNRSHPDDRRLRQVCHSLDAIANGGIRDHLGGGFHRYSTDAQWLVPHFEVMLYDNAMLAWCYVEAYRQTEDRRYAAVARGVFDFVLREMTSPEGAFYTAFDAEVDGREGQNYLWTRSDVEATLAAAGVSEADIHRFSRTYGLDDGPNFADPHHGNGRPDQNVLYLAEPVGKGGVDALSDPKLAEMRAVLLAERMTRKQPSLDTKVITSWNGLMIRALAYGGQVLNDRGYLDAAAKAADFLLANHKTADDGLVRTSRDGVTRYAGYLDDYAFLVQAMLALDAAGANERWRDAARALSLTMTRKFADPAGLGGYFFTAADADDLIVRQKVATDSPLPSGVAVAAMALMELGEPEAAKASLTAFAAPLEAQGEGMSALLQVAVLYLRDHPPFTAEPRSVEHPRVAPTDPLTVATAWPSPTHLTLTLTIAAGYHLAAHGSPGGVAVTSVSFAGNEVERVDGIDYPHGTRVAALAEAGPVYTDAVTLTVRFEMPPPGGTEIELTVAYQACDDSACLPTATKRVTVVAP